MSSTDPNASSNGGIGTTPPIDVTSNTTTVPSSTVVSMDSSAVSADLSLSMNLSSSTSTSTPTTINSNTDVVVKSESVQNALTNPGMTMPTPTTATTTRSPPLKRPRHKPGERRELLERAVRDVKEENISMRKAASRYNLAKSSLCDYVRKNHIVLPNNRCRPSAAAAAAAAANNSNTTDHQNPLGGVGSLLSGLQQQSLNRTGGGLFSHPADSLRNNHAATTKLESPWSNVSGLPTQVPMQNWSTFPLPSVKTLGGLPQIPPVPSPKQQHNEISNSDTHSPLENNLNGNSAVNTPSSSSFLCTPLPSESSEGQTITATAPFFNPTQLLTSSGVDAVRSLASIYAATAQQQLQQNNSNVNSNVTSNPNSQLNPTLLSTVTQSTPSLPNTAASAASIPLVFPNSDPSALNDSLQRILLTAQSQRALGDLFFPPPAPAPSPMISCFSAIPAEIKSKINHLPTFLNSLVTANTNSATNSANATNNANISSIPIAAVSDSLITRMPHSQKAVNDLLRFINMSPTPFHVVRSAIEMLKKAGFRQLMGGDAWKLQSNDLVFFTQNQSTLFAVAVGGAYKPGEGFSMIGAHTDSPCLRLKPISTRVKEGFVQLGVQTYGGGLWYTWFDRELTLAGRVIVRNSGTGALEERLIHINRPLVCIPSLAIHLNRNANKGFSPDPETQLPPIISTTIIEQLNGCEDGEMSTGGHPTSLMRLLAAELQCALEDIVDSELYLADCQPACVGGVHGEFIHAPRLDNQFCAFTSMSALVNSLPSLKDDTNVRVVCLYDHEEIGSGSYQGAASVLTEQFLRRITLALFDGHESESVSNNGSSSAMDTSPTSSHTVVEKCIFERSLTRSFFLSADQAHAIHPSWPEKHEPAHKPGFHQGIVLKHNVSQSYATNSQTSAIVKEIAKRSNVPIQEFVVRQDGPCGGTIGPIVASHLGVMTADVGGAQLAMHSCRETTCTSSVGHAVTLFTGFFEQLANILTNYEHAK